MRSWFENNNVIIKQTDKNLGICIINTTDYHEKVMKLLNDGTVYQKIIEKPDLLSILSQLRRNVSQIKNMISEDQYKFIEHGFQTNHSFPQFHIIPKVHKTPWVGRPIVSSMTYVTRNMAIVINVELEKYAKLLSTTIKDSRELIQHLDNQRVPETCNFFSLDVVSMYTNIPVNETLIALRNFGINSAILQMIRWCIDYNYFKYAGDIYKQLDGIPMGINFAVAFANLAIFILIESDPRLLNFKKHLIYWGRYLDDCNGIWKGSKEEFETFFTTINSINPKIQFTIGDFGKECVFLDLVAKINDDNRISFKLYQKPLNKYLYIPFNSCHPTATKRGWIKGELIRFRRNNSTFNDFKASTVRFYCRLRKRGYPSYFILNIFKKFSYSGREEELKLMSPTDFASSRANSAGLHFTKTMKHFIKLRRYIVKKGIKKRGPHSPQERRKERIVFSTDYNRRLEAFRLQRIFHPIPTWTASNPYLDTSKITVAYRIRNTLGSIFNHRIHNIKINRLIQNERESS